MCGRLRGIELTGILGTALTSPHRRPAHHGTGSTKDHILPEGILARSRTTVGLFCQICPRSCLTLPPPKIMVIRSHLPQIKADRRVKGATLHLSEHACARFGVAEVFASKGAGRRNGNLACGGPVRPPHPCRACGLPYHAARVACRCMSVRGDLVERLGAAVPAALPGASAPVSLPTALSRVSGTTRPSSPQ